MAEFTEVFKQARRMCKEMQCCCRRCPIGDDEGYCLATAWADDVNLDEVERRVMEWVKKHPEPQYPTWREWLIDQDIISVECIARAPSTTSSSAKYEQIVKIQPEFYCPIPAGIAEKLGLKPKEG